MNQRPVLLAILLCICLRTTCADEGLYVATFSVDITPQMGTPVGQGFIPVLKTVEHPLLARGILLKEANISCVVCALDLMEVHNGSYDFLRKSIARAAGISPSNVALQCLHQHTAPAIDTDALQLERSADDPRRIATAEYLAQISDRLSAAIVSAKSNWRSVTSIGAGKAKVDRVASNRRMEKPDGSIQGRGSSTKSSPQLRDLPEGLIDPWVRSVSFNNGKQAIAQLHYYASHPQSFYGDGRASYDVPGILRKKLEDETAVFQMYLTGCSGDVAFGKYNDGSRRARDELTHRMHSGIQRSIASLDFQPVHQMRWSVEEMKFPPRTDEAFTKAANEKLLASRETSESVRRKAAIAVAWINRMQAGQKIEISCLALGSIRLLHLPGEPFVQYQLAAQKMQPNRFVCVAGYADCGMGYIGGDRIYTDNGGYEQTYAFAGPCEHMFLSTIKRVLAR